MGSQASWTKRNWDWNTFVWFVSRWATSEDGNQLIEDSGVFYGFDKKRNFVNNELNNQFVHKLKAKFKTYDEYEFLLHRAINQFTIKRRKLLILLGGDF